MTRYEYGIFNVDKNKICSGNEVSPDDEGWMWLWNSPIELRLDRNEAENVASLINEQRRQAKTLDKYGPVGIRRRQIHVGEWEDLP